MSQIASKNLYELLGNDPELDPDRRAPEVPTKAIDKPVQRTGKRNAGADAPNGDRPSADARGGRQQNFSRGDQAGNVSNRAERDDGLRQDRHRDRVRNPRESGRGEKRGRGRGRGDYGGNRAARDDRHSHTGIGEHDKQAAHGWGAETAGAELNDEQAGDAIAKAELKGDSGFTPDVDAKDPNFSEDAAAPVEEEDKTKSYDQYLAEQAEKRLALGSVDIRKPEDSKKFPQGKAHERNPEEENYFAGAGGKAKREKEIKQKNLLTVDGQYYAAPDAGDRGGRGGRGRGGRGDRGDRGSHRGGRSRGSGEGRGGRGNRDAPRGGGRGGFNATDSSAFPALGGN